LSTDPKTWDEFDLIGRLLRPLAKDAPQALDLLDDAALLTAPAGQSLVITTDTMVEGVHFLPDDPPDLIARKLLRVNLSDLAAKRARPFGYFLNTTWPTTVGTDFIERFVAGLAHDQAEFGLRLFGGDTTSTSGPLVLSATLTGLVSEGAMLRRAGARAGDLLQVSGTIGDGILGLKALQTGDPVLAPLIDSYRLPQPRLDLQDALAAAHACADVSDGLIADAGHLAQASGLALVIDLDALPLSPEARQWADGRIEALTALASGGDDYQLVCAAAARLPGFTVVGRLEPGQGTTVRWRGATIDVARAGFRHGYGGFSRRNA
jgi:thiamine-monophosphate kinase